MTGNIVARWFADRPVGIKILSALALVAVATSVSGALALRQMSAMDERMNEVRSVNVRSMSILSDILGAQSQINHFAADRMQYASDPVKVRQSVEGTAVAVKRLDTALAAYEKQPKSAAAIRTVDELKRRWAEFNEGIRASLARQPLPVDMSVVVPGMQRATEDLRTIESEDANRATAAAHADYQQARTEVLVSLASGLLAAIVLALLVGRSITRRLRPVTEAMEAVAGGDLTRTVPVGGRDEIGAMALAVRRATTGLRETIGALAGSADLLNRESGQLAEITDDVVTSVGAVARRAHSADGAAERVSRHVQTVASGAEEMTASIKEIARSADEGARIASHAVSVVGTTNKTVSKLGESSTEIGNVVKVITSIAEQTNLLALNATIEAARAGDAGKGFAIVAGEVKDLAQETAKATEDIARRVQAIQADSESAVAAINEISSIIEQINGHQEAIASAVEEQTATTGEMNRNASDAAVGAREIAHDISEVAATANATTDRVSAGRKTTAELADLSSRLHGLASRFRY